MATAKFYFFDVGVANTLHRTGVIEPGSDAYGRALDAPQPAQLLFDRGRMVVGQVLLEPVVVVFALFRIEPDR